MAKRIGQLLVEGGHVTKANVKEALEAQKKQGGKLAQVLISLGHLTEEDLLACLGNQPGMTSVSLEQYAIDAKLREYITKEFAYTHEVMPMDLMGKSLTVAMAVPLDEATKAELEEQTGLRIRAVLCGSGIVRRTIEQYYGEADDDLEDDDDEAGAALPPEEVVPGPDAVRLRGVVDLLASVDHFPVLMEVHTRVLERLSDPNVTMDELTALVEQDPTLSANLLKVANSAAYSPRTPFESVQRAIIHLGLRPLNNIVVGFAVLSRLSAEAYFDLSRMYQNAYRCALLTKLLCDETKVGEQETAFTAGLLANLGHIALRIVSHNRTERMVAEGDNSGMSSVELEESVLGVSGSEVGYHLAQHWRLPETLANVIRFHDRLDRIDDPTPLTLAVALSTACMAREDDDGALGETDPNAEQTALLGRLGVSTTQLAAVATRYQSALEDASGLETGIY